MNLYTKNKPLDWDVETEYENLDQRQLSFKNYKSCRDTYVFDCKDKFVIDKIEEDTYSNHIKYVSNEVIGLLQNEMPWLNLSGICDFPAHNTSLTNAKVEV